MLVGCVPLDDRPVSTQLPALVCAVAGARLLLPPPAGRGVQRVPGDVTVTSDWLDGLRCDALVVSLEGLTSGGLIASRTGDESLAELLDRLAPLQRVRPPVHAAVVVPRTPDTDDAAEEPAYWATHGRALHALSAALHTRAGVAAARAGVPADVRLDWLRRRLRQHLLALAAVDLVADRSLASLVVGVDDAATRSLSVPDATHLAEHADRLEVGARVSVGHGADETSTVLCARAVLGLSGLSGPRVAVVCADPGGLARTAAYESSPVLDTAFEQLRAAGAHPQEGPVLDHQDAADVVLVVHPPDGAGDWAVHPPGRTDTQAAAATADLVADHLAAGRRVAVADVAQPNGADPALVAALGGRGLLGRLDGWAAWNTAGNSLGTVAAHLVAGHVGRATGTWDGAAHRRLLAARLVEDWAWMCVVRHEVRARTGGDPHLHDHVTADHPALTGVAARLQELLAGVAPDLGWHVVDSSVRLPWNRTFEVHIDLAPTPGGRP
ncbi:DUF4127 family protein [Jannaschia sp. R86511]|uniref:DUF4127 family protein n=1 Tax=Jannaschia sp. R86511 TaxID=3093853 RepID=UPI0036D36133